MKSVLCTMGLVTLTAGVASASLIVDSTSSANPGSTIDLNVNIDGAGAGSTPSPWFSVSGSTARPGAFGGTIGITIDGMKNVSVESSTLGDELTDGDIDRDGDGFMGVIGAPNAGGIGADATNREGLAFAIDEITNIDPSLSIQITGINVQNIGRAGTDPVDESFTIVNLSTRAFLTIVPLNDGVSAGTIDVSSLGLTLSAGSPSPIAALYSGDVGGFRVDGLTLAVIPEPASLGLLGFGGIALLALRRRRA